MASAFDQLLAQDQIEFAQPTGTVVCPDTGHLLVVAGGTGAAVAFSCARFRAAAHPDLSTTILWCADDEEDFYDLDLIKLTTTIHLETIADPVRNEKNKGLVWLDEHASCKGHDDVIISGSPPFVYEVTDLLLAKGFKESQLQSDVYDYAPR